MPKLILLDSKRAVREFELSGALAIGRHASNQIQLDEERASRTHCRVRFENGRALLEDLDSANGVYLNGLKVKSCELKHNDRIVVGGTTLLFEDTPALGRRGDTVVLREAITLPPAEKPAPTKDALHKIAAVKPRSRGRRSKKLTFASVAGLVVSTVGFCAGIYLLWQALHPRDDSSASAENENARTRSPTIKLSIPADSPPPDERERASVKPAPDSARQNARLDEALKAALAQRDRALASGNFLGAKAAVRAFFNALNASESASAQALAGKREAAETERVINAAFELELTQARDALTARRFQLFTQRCTALLSNDPAGNHGAQARTLLEGLDERTAPLALAAKSKAREELALGHLELARAAAENALGELSGTRWAGDISALHLQLIMAAGLLDEMELARAKKAAAGEKVSVSFAAKKFDGVLLKLAGLNAQIQSGAATLALNLNALDSATFTRLLEQLGLRERHAELACLWTLLGRADEAYAESESALKNPGSAPLAACLAGMLANASNLHLYDFSGWRQQADWDALGGSWMTQNEKYVLVSADGGETVLKEERIGGAFPLKNARLNFDLEILQPSPGWFFACEFGAPGQSLSLQFSEGELALADKTGAKTRVDFKLQGAPLSARVEVVIDGDAAQVRVNAQAVAELVCPGISAVKGTVGFQARQCACSLDNVILRTVQAR